MWDWALPADRVMGRSDSDELYRSRTAAVAAPSPTNHQSNVTTEVTRATGSTTTACTASSHSPGSAALVSLGLGRWPVPSGPALMARILAIRHRSRSANQRAGARTPTAAGDRPGTSKPTVATDRLPSTRTRPAAAITGAVSRYNDSAAVRRNKPKRSLAPGRHRRWAPGANDTVIAPD